MNCCYLSIIKGIFLIITALATATVAIIGEGYRMTE
jgi:hypothetical protein